jgi:hypothetical protein
MMQQSSCEQQRSVMSRYLLLLFSPRNMSHRPLFFLFALVILAAGGFAYCSKPTITPVALTCSDGYTVVAKYIDVEHKGITQRILAVVSKDGVATRYDLRPAVAASGAKFSARDGTASLWEHDGEFALLMGEQIVANCKRPGSRTP